MPFIIFMRVSIVRYPSYDNAGKLIHKAGCFHLKTNRATRDLADPVTLEAILHNPVAGRDQPIMYDRLIWFPLNPYRHLSSVAFTTVMVPVHMNIIGQEQDVLFKWPLVRSEGRVLFHHAREVVGNFIRSYSVVGHHLSQNRQPFLGRRTQESLPFELVRL